MAFCNYILLVVLLLLIGFLVISAKQKLTKKGWLKRTLNVTAVIVIVFITCEVVLFPNLKSIQTTGEYDYVSSVLELTDTSRIEDFKSDGSPRKLSLLVYYPCDNEITNYTCPLIVFSHGAISTKTSNVSLYKELASHGYVVASIDHTYHALCTEIDGMKIPVDFGYLKELNGEDSHAALGTARQRDDIKAVIALESPYMCDITGIDGNEFIWDTSPYKCAVMNIYSDSGIPLTKTDNKYVQNRNYLQNNGNIRYYYIEGSNHFTLTDLARTSPALCALLGGGYEKSGYETLRFINQKSLAFFDEYLR